MSRRESGKSHYSRRNSLFLAEQLFSNALGTRLSAIFAECSRMLRDYSLLSRIHGKTYYATWLNRLGLMHFMIIVMRPFLCFSFGMTSNLPFSCKVYSPPPEKATTILFASVNFKLLPVCHPHSAGSNRAYVGIFRAPKGDVHQCRWRCEDHPSLAGRKAPSDQKSARKTEVS